MRRGDLGGGGARQRSLPPVSKAERILLRRGRASHRASSAGVHLTAVRPAQKLPETVSTAGTRGGGRVGAARGGAERQETPGRGRGGRGWVGGAPARDGARAPHTRSRRAARERPPRQRPRAVGGGPGKPGGSSRADRRAALPVSGRTGLPQPWCFHHAREGKEGRADRGRGGKEAEGQAVGEAGGRASPRTSTTSLFTPPRPALPRPAPPAPQAAAARKARRGSLKRGTRP